MRHWEPPGPNVETSHTSALPSREPRYFAKTAADDDNEDERLRQQALQLFRTSSDVENESRNKQAGEILSRVMDRMLLEVAQEAIDNFNNAAKRERPSAENGLTRSWSKLSEVSAPPSRYSVEKPKL